MISFTHDLGIAQFLLPPICTGILLGGFLLYLYMSWKYKSTLYMTVAVFAFLGILFVGSETMILSIGGWLHNRELSVQFHRIEQLAGACFLFALPYALMYLLELNDRMHRINRILAVIGLGYAIIVIVAAYVKPDLFISMETTKASWLTYEADYGRGQEGILYAIRDALLGIYIIYSITVVIIDIIWHKNLNYLVYPVIGLLLAFFGAIVDTVHVHTGVFIDFFPESYFSRFSVGITMAIMFFMSSVTRKFITYAQELEIAHKIISISEEKYRFLVEGTNDCILSLDLDMRCLNANRAALNQLVINIDNLEEFKFYDLVYIPQDESEFTMQFIQEKINILLNEGRPVYFKTFLKAHGTYEPREYHIRIEHINIDDKNEILMKASSVPDDSIMRYINSEKMHFTIGNYLIAAEEICNRLVLNLPRYIDKQQASAIKLGLREIIINAIEHGNLNISFNEKSQATENGNYMEFILSRQKDAVYRNKRVTIEFLLNSERVIYKISDEGNGFDYKNIISMIEDDVDAQMLAHGRGLRMAFNIFDSVEFNRRGNQVLLIKYFNKKMNRD